MSEDTARALANSTLKLDDSFGLAAHAGIDFKVNDRGAIRLDARWIDIGTVRIDPLVYGVAYVFRF